MQVTPNQNKPINNVPPYSGTQVNNPQNTQGQQIQPQVQQYCNQAAACSAAPQGPATPPTPPNTPPQNVQVPATTSGVNIQIFNPSVYIL